MRTGLTILFATCWLIPGGAQTSSPAPEQRAVMVWDKACITEVYKTQDTRLEAPMVNGEADKKHIIAYGVGMKLIVDCGHVEVRRDR